MRISYLELKNYRKFRDLRLQLPDGIIGILGLNGAGKTTIIEAIAWGLFGNVEEVVRTNKESIRRLGAGPTDSVSVALEFELDGTEYRLEREMGGRSLSMKALLRSRGEVVAEGDRAVKSKVLDLLGMDHKSFFTSVFARQKELNELQNFTPSERKKVVLRMLRIDSVDSVIQSVREDRRDVTERIRGAQMVISDADGADREEAIGLQLDALTKKLESVGAEVRQAEDKERTLASKMEEVKKWRNSLKAEVDELNSLTTDLRGKRSAIAEQKASRQRLERNIQESEKLLSKLPELEVSNGLWQEALKAKEAMDQTKVQYDKKEHIRGDIKTLRQDIAEAKKEVASLEKKRGEETEIQEKIKTSKNDRKDSDRHREELSRTVAELTARISERNANLSKDRKKLEEVEAAGEDGACPTCERPLEETYDLIVGKLRHALESSEHTISEDEKRLSEAKSNLASLDSRINALDKRLQHQEDRLSTVRQDMASVAARAGELKRLEERLAAKSREVEGMGELRYSAEEHGQIKKSLVKLQKDHDQFVELGERRRHLAAMKTDSEALGEALAENETAEKELRGKAEALEPKRALYEKAIKDFDGIQHSLGEAKDAANALKLGADRMKAEAESAKKNLELVRQQKKMISSEKDRADELGALEEALVTFKGHLIGKVAPALSETTSEVLALMTDGKYERIHLDEDYQISVDDDGVLHPLDRFSGGEADLANLSLRLAISRIIAERASTSQMNFLILDEIFGSLDTNRKRSVMAALMGLSSQFRQVLLISHVEEIKDLMTTVIRVEELPDGSSTAKMVN
jgi:exonuclease SbcC